MCSSDIFLAILAVFFPPIAVWIKSGICTADSLINILLCTLGYVPGLLHAWYIIYLYPEPEYEYESIAVNDTESQRGVTYYYVGHRPSSEHVRQQAAADAAGAGNAQLQRQYGTIPAQHQQGPLPMRYPSQQGSASAGQGQGPSNAEGQEGVPPSYEQAVKGDNKVQT